MWKRIAALAGATCVVSLTSAKAQTSVCVEVEVRSWAELDSEVRAAQDDDAASEAEDALADEVAGQGENEVDPSAVPAAANEEPAANDVVAGSENETAWSERGAVAVQPVAAQPVAPGTVAVQAVAPGTIAPGVVAQPLAPVPSPPGAPQVAPPVAPRRPPFDPPLYLRRLIEYRITHMPGFEAVREGCAQRMVVQFYPLQEGWTMFARYDGTAREEKVDRVQLDEFPALAARLTEALLNDSPLEETLSRRTVLRSDSEEEMRRVRGRAQLRLSIGTELIMGLLPTARSSDASAENVFRVSAPLSVEAGARTTYRAWALDAYLGMLVGTARQSVPGSGAGHADYTFGMTAALHFLRYTAPDAASSLYGGGGASFQIHRYRILPGPTGGDDRGLVGGGLNLDLVIGYEVMRASALSFFVEIQALLPAYGFDSENSNGAIRAWLPAAVVQIGLLR